MTLTRPAFSVRNILSSPKPILQGFSKSVTRISTNSLPELVTGSGIDMIVDCVSSSESTHIYTAKINAATIPAILIRLSIRNWNCES